MFDIGFWIGSHIFFVAPLVLAAFILVVARDEWVPSVQELFRAIGPGLAQLAALIPAWRQPDQVHEEIRRQADWDFWLQARDHGTPAEQAIAPDVLTALGYAAPVPQPSSHPFLIQEPRSERRRLLEYMHTTTNPDARRYCELKLARLTFEETWGYRGTRDEMSQDLARIAKGLLLSANLRKVAVRDGSIVRLNKGGEALVTVSRGRITLAHPSGALAWAEFGEED